MIIRRRHRKNKTIIVVHYKKEYFNDASFANSAFDLFSQIDRAFPLAGTIQMTIEEFSPPEMSRKIVAYWYGEIIHKIREGLYDTGICLNDAGTHQWLMARMDENATLSTALLRKFASAVHVDQETGRISEVVPVISELDAQQLSHLFDPIIAWASEHLHQSIISPDEFI